jgi:hypothetical protein
VRGSDVFHSLRSTHDDWNEILTNPSYSHKNHKISWYGRPEKHRSPFIVRRSYVANLISKSQYTSMIARDDSIIQIFYEFENNDETLSFAKLGYFNSGVEDISGINELSDLATTSASVIELFPSYTDSDLSDFDDPIVPWIRIDYDPHSASSPLHHSCHMHIGLFNYARIPLTRVPTPRQFIEFIIALCYPNDYRAKRLDSDGNPADLSKLYSFNEDTFEKIDNVVYDIIPHFFIPNVE